MNGETKKEEVSLEKISKDDSCSQLEPLNEEKKEREVTPEELLMKVRTLEREFDRQTEKFCTIIMSQMDREERQREKERKNSLIVCIVKCFCFLSCVFIWTLGYFESSVKINRSYYEKIDKIEERMIESYEKIMGSDQKFSVPNREWTQQQKEIKK